MIDIRLRSIVKELQHKEASMEAKKKLKQTKEQNSRLQAKRLGKLQYLFAKYAYIYLTYSIQYGTLFLTKIRYVEPDIDVQLSEEITGSLRTLKVHAQTHPAF